MLNFSERLHGILSAPNHADIHRITRGLEKESLRVAPEGTLATSPHPKALGSALTHPRITTDYSEALLEFITPPTESTSELIETLDDLHSLTYTTIENESLWVNSMPCVLMSDSTIPVAQYGTSNSGKMKTVYRLGLGERYGRSMQTISGIHFNFSVSETLWTFLREQDQSTLSLQQYKTQGYFKLIRNFRRYFWLLLYLFGASPAVCKSFLRDKPHTLLPFGEDTHTLHSPYGTSLRMGNLGYQSDAQQSLKISYNCLDTYIDTLCQAISQPHQAYQDIGIKNKEGQYHQLNEGLLQIENEFYSVIRPKRSAESGQTALNALEQGGVEYIEVRCLDLNPFLPLGINESQIQFLDLFLLFCLLEESPLSDNKEHEELQINQHRMVYEGRKPDLKLFFYGKERTARDWGKAIIGSLTPLAELMDNLNGSTDYQRSLNDQALKLENSELTPSARILSELREQQISFYRLAMNAAQNTRQHFKGRSLNAEKQAMYKEMSQQSLDDQNTIEKNDTLTFEDFLKQYYAQYRCTGASIAESQNC